MTAVPSRDGAAVPAGAGRVYVVTPDGASVAVDAEPSELAGHLVQRLALALRQRGVDVRAEGAVLRGARRR